MIDESAADKASINNNNDVDVSHTRHDDGVTDVKTEVKEEP